MYFNFRTPAFSHINPLLSFRAQHSIWYLLHHLKFISRCSNSELLSDVFAAILFCISFYRSFTFWIIFLKLHFCYFVQPAIFRLICCMDLSCLPCVLLALSSSCFACVGHGLHNGFRTCLWKRATPDIVAWFVGRTWKNDNKWYTELPKLLLNFYSLYTQFTNVVAGRII